ncbi:hypothetical protein BT96DRAFT_1018237 [Gymnopus androsaceus JB14]|uniref:Uncharacterized protein n=1 Tax=Gymnopus androsaceus JB14 TaxID=1447944 RepID=A0A6A4HXG3_9AGAR|nr:hypothetical protein BT96DRAFT_1018237 [Gymnopus androsaceus JB14]
MTASYPTARFKAFLPPQPAPSSSYSPPPAPLLLPLSDAQIRTAISDIEITQNGNGKRKRAEVEAEDSARPQSVDPQMGKRKIRKVIHPKHYENGAQMMKALEACFRTSEDTTFLGTYHVLNDEPEITDKSRIQLVTHEIWRATGYRFTVKDHPPDKHGHTTRLWCSQDIQRKPRSRYSLLHAPDSNSTSNDSPNTKCKPRYPCSSRLLVSSRAVTDRGMTDSRYRLVTVRMYHHFPHEPYRDMVLPEVVVKDMCPFPQSAKTETVAAQSPDCDEGDERGSDDCSPSASSSLSSITVNPNPNSKPSLLSSPNPKPIMDPSFLTEAASSPSSSAICPPAPPLDMETFQRTMRTHIGNIRDFCDGLEYQLQFNDFRMLQELEEKGKDFLVLVRGCLEREGRLVREGEEDQGAEEIETSAGTGVEAETESDKDGIGEEGDDENEGLEEVGELNVVKQMGRRNANEE